MGVTYTKEQQQVIDLRNRNLLVSAAAGSGKTAVLVERVLARLSKDAQPIDMDRLLIVTYTEAAAGEMRERIRAAIEKALEKNPEDAHLQRQSTLVHRAQITTIHGFCLNVIRDYFHVIDLDPAFRVGEAGELSLLQRDVLNELLERRYEEGSEAFLNFTESFAPGRDDAAIDPLILALYEHSRSYPDPEAWLLQCVRQYDVPTMEAFVQTPFVQRIFETVQKQVQELIETTTYAIRECESEGGPAAYADALGLDLKLYRDLQTSSDFDELNRRMRQVQWARLGTNKKGTSLKEKEDLVKTMRKQCKDAVAALQKRFFYEESHRMWQDLYASKSNMTILAELTLEFADAYRERKRSKNMVDFSDMLYYALQILTEKQGDTFVPSAVARAYQEQFVEVMIDEYQDSNLVQDTILSSVSRVSRGDPNIFMVGDVKQSIYRFQLSRPELFMEKYDSYTETESKAQKIDLHKNFRSRREVLDATNFVFRQIMTKEFGGIEYDEKAALHVGADYEEKPNCETEVCLVEAEGLRRKESLELEATAIARRIKELVGSQDIYDKEKGIYRKAGYGDIVILLRVLKGWTEPFLRILAEEGIPAYSSSKSGYFQVREIQMLLDYLRVLDNPRQDIPFVAVLASVFGKLGSEELARLQSEMAGKCFYERARAYAEQGSDSCLRGKLEAFFAQYEALRSRVPYTAIHTLLWEIIGETGYDRYVGALPGGEQRMANLNMLIEKAIAFEPTSYKGLFHFIRYIDQLNKYEVDYGEASLTEEGRGVVHLVSIHKSKGLEYPIVFVAGMEHGFNRRETGGEMVIHPDWGVGLDAVDVERRTKVPTLLKSIIQEEVHNEATAEQLRLLYVAMTRAKEKLILVGTVPKPDAYSGLCMRLLGRKETALPYSYIAGAECYFDWVVPALYRATEDIPIMQRRLTLEDLWVEGQAEDVADAVTKDYLQNWDTDVVYDEAVKEQLQTQFSYEYPYQSEPKTKQKVSVSELKKKGYLEEEELEVEEVIPLLPRFLQDALPMSGALRGTAYHKVLELLDFTKEYDLEGLRNSVEEMTIQGYLTAEMAESVSLSEILHFVQSPIGRRAGAADRRGSLHKEQPFVLGEETILVQGIMDAYFEEDGQWVILDYKTDRLYEEEAFAEHYRLQLNYYADALSRITGKPVKEKLIYSFAMQKCIKL